MTVEIVLDEQRTAAEIRAAWLERKRVRLTLSEKCIVRTVVGRPTNVAITGAFVTVDGWHIPTSEIKGVGKPTVGDVQEYAQVMHDLREAASSCEFCHGMGGGTLLVGDGWRSAGACPKCGATP